MARGKVYEYIVIYHPKPTKEQNELGVSPKSEIIADIARILAIDEKQVAILAARAIPENYTNKLDDVEIVVRPF